MDLGDLDVDVDVDVDSDVGVDVDMAVTWQYEHDRMSVYVVMPVYMPYISLCIEYIVDIVPRFKHICAFAHFRYAYLPIINDDADDDDDVEPDVAVDEGRWV